MLGGVVIATGVAVGAVAMATGVGANAVDIARTGFDTGGKRGSVIKSGYVGCLNVRLMLALISLN